MAFVGPMSWHWCRCAAVMSGNYKMVEISNHAGIKFFFSENKPINSQLKFLRLFMGHLVSLNVRVLLHTLFHTWSAVYLLMVLVNVKRSV